ncbi:MAG: hypothetical protein HQL70_10545 [Magnetococcales bacterium]|nr:hypothetical protein [Magnetococcales bacterium]
MDKTLVKILNMATSGSYEESNIAIEQAYKYMKKRGSKLEDIEFNSLYNGNVVAIKLIARFAHDQATHQDRDNYISGWAKAIYGGNSKGGVSQDVALKNASLERELATVKQTLMQTQQDLLQEQENVEKYLTIINEKYGSLVATLENCQYQAKVDSEKSKKRIKDLELSLKNANAKNSKAEELYKYTIHAKELQISNIKDQLKVLVGSFRRKALSPLVA